MVKHLLLHNIYLRILFTSIILFNACQINEPHLPTWDVEINIPILKRTYSLENLLDRSNFIKYYNEGSNKNLIYYSRVINFDSISISNKLNIDEFSETLSETIESFFLIPDSLTVDINLDWLGYNDHPKYPVVIYPINNEKISITTDAIESFEYAIIESGKIDLEIISHLPTPVSLTINNFILKNIATGEILYINNDIFIPFGSSIKIKSIKLPRGIKLYNKFLIECVVSTSGTNGKAVTLPENSFTIKVNIADFKVSEAKAKIPFQVLLTIEDSFLFEDDNLQPTKINSLKIDDGNINLTITNTLDVNIKVSLIIYNLKNSFGQVFSDTKFLERKQTINIKNYSLKDYSFVSLNDAPSNVIKYKIIVAVDSSNNMRIIRNTDGISGKITISNLKIKEFIGQLKPYNITPERYSLALKLEQLKDKIKFQNIIINNAILQLVFKSTAECEFKIIGHIEAKNNIGEKAILRLNKNTLGKEIISPRDSILRINADSLNVFLKKFTHIPDSIIIYLGGVINPNYKTVIVKNNDIISGSINVELPLYISIQNAEYYDSVKVELTDDDKNYMRNVNSLDTGLRLTNGLPFNLTFVGKLYDEQNNFLTYFPPYYPNQDTAITIIGASTNSNGDVIASREQLIKFQAKKSEIDKIIKASYMKIKLIINTSAENNFPVKIKSTDNIDIYAFGKLNYKVNH